MSKPVHDGPRSRSEQFNQLRLREVAKRYVQLGAHVIPLFAPMRTSPTLPCSCSSRHRCKQVGKHPRIPWGDLMERRTPADLAALWPYSHAFNLALITGAPGRGGFEHGFMFLDFDLKYGGLKTLEHLEREGPGLGDPLRLLTGGGGAQLLYQWDSRIVTASWAHERMVQLGKSDDIHLLPGLDTRSGRPNGGRGYSCVPPSFHKSGREYFWTEDSFDPGQGRLALREPPQIPTWLLETVVAALKLRNPRPTSGRTHAFVPTDGPENPDRLADALRFISPDDYDSWFKVGAALFHELGQAGLEPWLYWSAGSPKFDPAECERKWATFGPHPRPLTAGFIYAEAKRNGWQPPRRDRLARRRFGGRRTTHSRRYRRPS